MKFILSCATQWKGDVRRERECLDMHERFSLGTSCRMMFYVGFPSTSTLLCFEVPRVHARGSQLVAASRERRILCRVLEYTEEREGSRES